MGKKRWAPHLANRSLMSAKSISDRDTTIRIKVFSLVPSPLHRLAKFLREEEIQVAEHSQQSPADSTLSESI